MYFMGIDIGTSSAKTAIFNEKGDMLALASKSYNFDAEKPGYAEQDPEIWWDAVVDTMRRSTEILGEGAKDVRTIGLSGQRHGLVPLDGTGHPVRKAILHCDVRAKDIAKELTEESESGLSDIMMNPVFPGFQMVSLCWMRKHEPELYERIQTELCPKDYIRYRLTGELGAESTDASGTLLYDMRREEWSKEIFEKLGLNPLSVPEPIHNSCEISSEILPDVARKTGLPANTAVVYGGADQAMHSLGNGICRTGLMMATIGTSGQILTLSDKPVKNPELNTHTFRHVREHSWYGMAAVLYAGSTLNWFRRTFAADSSYEELSRMASGVAPCAEGLVFFPCMGGERTPYLDSETRGMFSGISMCHTKEHFARAIMEGVSFAIKTGIDKMNQLYGETEKLICAGGGVKGRVWAQIQSDIYGREIHVSTIPEQACLGAAITAAVGAGAFSSLEEACDSMVKETEYVLEPVPENQKRYEEFYEKVYQKIYAKNKEIFHNMDLFIN